MKKLIYIVLFLLPLITQGQSQSVTLQFRRPDPQVNSLDSIYYTFPGISPSGYRWLWNAEKTRSFVNNKTSYINTYLKHYADSLYFRTVNLFDSQTASGDKTWNGLTTFNGGVVGKGDFIYEGGPGNRYQLQANGFGINLVDIVTGKFVGIQSSPSPYFNFNINGGTGRLKADNLTNHIIDWQFPDKAGTIALVGDTAGFGGTFAIKDSTLNPNKNLNDVPNKATARLNLNVYSKSEIDTKVQLKQPRIISALPTQTITRPVVGDSVNRAIAKLVFRGDSLASAVGNRLLISDTATMSNRFVHKALAETITGPKTFSTQITTTSTAPTQAQFGANQSGAVINLSGATATVRDFRFQTNSVNRWYFRVDGSTESGSNAGSNFTIVPVNDGGTLQSPAFTIIRSSGAVQLPLLTASQLLKLDGSKNIVNAIAGTDYLTTGTLPDKFLRLTGSGTGAATTISFPHGQTGVTAASIVVVTPINAASSGISFVTCDSVNLNVTWATAPVSGTNNISLNVFLKP